VWRFLTYPYAHGSLKHCAKNLVMLLLVSIPLEMCNHWARVTTVWVVGTLGAVFGVTILDPLTNLVGASGCICAMIGAHFASIILNWREDAIARTHTFPWTKRPVKKLVFNVYRIAKILLFSGYVLTDIIHGTCKNLRRHQASYGGHTSQEDDPCMGLFAAESTSFTAHFSGLFVGFLIGFIVLENRNVEVWETKVRAVCSIMLLSMFVIGLFWNVYPPKFVAYYPQKTDYACYHNATTVYNITTVTVGMAMTVPTCLLIGLSVCFSIYCAKQKISQ
jgi:rhomboid-related protein 1/2/3